MRPSSVSRPLLAAAILLACPVRVAQGQGEGAPAEPSTCPDPGSVVTGVGFTDTVRMAWDMAQRAFGYNVYLGSIHTGTAFGGDCLYWAVPETATLLHGRPPDSRGFTFQVTGLFPEGEGSMGFASGCVPRVPIRPCTCTLAADAGPCDGVCPRWSFEAATGQCQQFIWGCCGGNANNFETEEACRAACLDPCKLPAVVGPCDAAVPRWYFSVLSGHCEQFVWGGCGGNANNFTTQQACEEACPMGGSAK